MIHSRERSITLVARYGTTTHLFRDILALEPEWPDALDAQLWFRIIQGEHAY